MPELTTEERAAYGNRVDFFAMIPTQYRADVDWRSALGPELAGEVLELHTAGSIATLERGGLDGLGFSERAKTIRVETTKLDTLLEQRGIEKIDFLSMDIEGAELAALHGFEIKRFNPELCVIETAHHDEVTAYFDANGYELIEKYLKADKINLYYQRKPAE